MKKLYGISWKSKKDNISGIVELELDSNEVELGAEILLERYISRVWLGEIDKEHSDVAYLIQYFNYPKENIVALSVFRVIKNPNELKSSLDDKTKDKIQKLLNLSMSDNENEAKIALDKAYELMKKHSLTRDDLDRQDIIQLKLTPKGKKVSKWEMDLLGLLSEYSGVFFAFIQSNPVISVKKNSYMLLTGRERDVLNMHYLYECYAREINKRVKDKKKADNLTTKQANDYRLGLIYGATHKLQKSKESFFSTNDDKLYDIVSIDTRIEEASKLFSTKSKAQAKIKATRELTDGYEDGQKIHINQATEDKSKTQHLLS